MAVAVGSVCRSEAGWGAYVVAEHSGADIASGAGDRASGEGAVVLKMVSEL